MIHVIVKLFATLREGRFAEETREYESGADVASIVRDLGIPEKEAALILINGRHADLSTQLSDQGVLAIFPPIGGG
jgi:sulfur-carrier protein